MRVHVVSVRVWAECKTFHPSWRIAVEFNWGPLEWAQSGCVETAGGYCGVPY